MTDYDIFDSVIHSDERCTYSKVNEYLDNPGSHPGYDKVGDMLRDFSDLAAALKKQTKDRGHIDFETKKPISYWTKKENQSMSLLRNADGLNR